MTIGYSLDSRLRGNDRRGAGMTDGGCKDRGEKRSWGRHTPRPPAGSILHLILKDYTRIVVCSKIHTRHIKKPPESIGGLFSLELSYL